MVPCRHQDRPVALDDVRALRVLHDGVHVFLRMHEDFLRAIHIGEAQLVGATALVRLAADAHGLAVVAVVGVGGLAVEHAPDDHRVIGIALVEGDDHLLPDTRDGRATPARTRPRL